MDDLVQFLRDRLDEDEQTARAAHAPNWSTDGRRGLHYGVEDGWMTDALTTADAAHIARHDPARALREVEAKRQAIEHYEKVRRLTQDHDAYVLAEGAVMKQIQIMALPYADHPDYQDAWRP